MIGFYPGRFQPFHNGHLARVKAILSAYPNINLIVGIAGYEGELNQSNFLEPDEAVHCVALALSKLEKLSDVIQVRSVRIASQDTLEQSYARFFQQHRIDHVFSGSRQSINAIASILPNVIIHEWHDSAAPKGGVRIHAEDVRMSILQGNDWWRDVVDPAVADYFLRKDMRERLTWLPRGAKHRWPGRSNST